ncbi:MAG: transposase [Rhodospirillales bacterium]|nr:transposase [Rhodospirillales bacterium]
MARLARAVVPSVPHHVTQRGNRRQQTFFSNDDYRLYRDLMATWCERLGVEIWAYCLMPNHVHLVAVPDAEDGLRLAIGEAHRRYSRHINDREGWRGHLWQGRFTSFPMDDAHALMAARYIELNPVRARLVRKPHRWKWSSAGAHLNGRDDVLSSAAPLLGRVDDWQAFLAEGLGEDEMDTLRRHERTGRPLGSDDFIDRLEDLLGRMLRPRKPGPKPGARSTDV